MNSFGRIFKVHIFGESHGESVGLVIDGCPAGLSLTQADFIQDIERRKGGQQKGTTPRKEDDIPLFKSGIFNDKDNWCPIAILFENKNTRSGIMKNNELFPGQDMRILLRIKNLADNEDYRGGGHFSGRLTVCLVAAGVIAKKLLAEYPVNASILEIGGETDLEKGLQKAIDAKDSIGGIVECRVTGLPVGLGEPFFDSVESVLAMQYFRFPLYVE